MPILIDNSSSGLPADFHDALRHEYDKVAGKVRFLGAQEVANIPENTGGWFSQQILKVNARDAALLREDAATFRPEFSPVHHRLHAECHTRYMAHRDTR